jgi:hypothetical protein
MKPMPSFLCLIAVMFAASFSAHSEWIEVTGSASTKDVSYAEAREAARLDALRQAMLEFGVRLSSHQSLKNGVLVSDELNADSQVSVRREQILEENVNEETISIRYAADLERVPECPGSDAGKYKKSLALLGFNLQVPGQASIGGLNGIEHGLTSALAESLSAHESMVLFERGYDAPFADAYNAPTSLDGQRMLTQAMTYAKQLNVQFVVSGVVRDLGLVNPKAYSTSLWRRSIKFFAQANERRRFSVDLFVHDGLSGELIWQSNFATEGAWTVGIEEQVGFGSQVFWKMGYGQAVAALLDDMAYSLDQQLRCQPFMTRIARVDGKILHFGSGASSGLKPGDKLSVYRSYNYHDAFQRTGIELNNTKTVLTVSQVHPNFASGTVNIDPGRVNIQQDDVLIIW